MATYKGQFGIDFKKNKKTVDDVAVVRSKGLKNEIAGYITAHLRRELEEQKEKESMARQEEPVSGTETIEEQLVS